MATDGEAMPLMEGSRTPNRYCCSRRLLLLNLRHRRPSAPKDPPYSTAPRLRLCEGDAKGRIRFQDPRANPVQRSVQRHGPYLQPSLFTSQSNPTRSFCLHGPYAIRKIRPVSLGPFRPLSFHDPFPVVLITPGAPASIAILDPNKPKLSHARMYWIYR